MADHDELNRHIRRAAGRRPVDEPTEASEDAAPALIEAPPVPAGPRGSADIDNRTPSERMTALIRDQLNKPR